MKVEISPEALKGIISVLRREYVPDTALSFPKGKWATIQSLEEQLEFEQWENENKKKKTG